jgi:hypothetical protein
MGAVTNVSITHRDKTQNRRLWTGTCKFSTSYSANGDTLSPAQLGLTKIDEVVVLNQQASGYHIGFNGLSGTSALIQAYAPTTGLEASGNLATTPGTIRFKVWGY